MPTPVTTARQCLTLESAHALDEAVAVARRRGHGQTTSLHAVSAILSLPSSLLRDACARARNSAYSPRLQFKALELCLSVSLDRVPASQLSPDDPPVSNSLMAAIKRSQANQRRQPENFNLYQQQQTSSAASMSCIKVELRNLILSILDDPVVSRVFGEAGFPSSEIKLAIIRPLPQVFKFSRFKAPPMFLCNLGSDNSDLGPIPSPGRKGFSFPFMGFTNGDENCRRIGEVLARYKGKNPLLIGVCAYDALKNFSDGIERRKDNILPQELLGVNLISIENDIRNQNSEKGCFNLKFEKVGKYFEQNLGTGLILNLGDLKSFEDLSDSMSYDVVEKLTKLLQLNGKKVWLIGSISSYEYYLKLISRFPSIEKDWDLQLLPITSVRTSMAESHPKSSLMESFVPFGGFFSTISEFNSSLNGSYRSVSRCHQCNEKCEQEIVVVSKGELVSSVADQYQSNLPSWLQMTEVGTNKASDAKTRDDGVVLGAKVAGVQKKWNNICQRLHHVQLPGSNIHPSWFPSVAGLPEKCSSNITNASIDFQDSRKLLGVPIPEENTEKPSREDHPESDGIRYPCSFSNSSLADSNQESPATVTSVTTDLGLRINRVPTGDNQKEFVNRKNNVAVGSGSISGNSSSSSSLDFNGQFDLSNFKKIFRALIEEVSWQDEAVRIISQTIANCRTRNENGQGASQRRYIWLNFRGPDRCGMKKIVSALAEIVYGSREKLISADLSPENLLIRSQSQDGNWYNVMFRGKTIIDYVGDELSKKPSSVVFLENIDQAEVPTQNCLSRAVQTGRFLYSNGREVGINNAIFVTTSAFSEDEIFAWRKAFSSYSEEKILRAKGFPMQLLLEQAPAMFMNKRKTNQNLEEHQVSEFIKRAHVTSTRNLDLNLPAEDNAHATDDDQINSDNDSTSGNSRSWLLDFINQLDKTVIFKPFDFDTLADRMLNNINESFHKIVGSKCSFDIDPQVLEQLLAAAYLSGRERVVEKWVEEVLSRGFVEFSKRYNLNVDSIVKLVACKGMFLEKHMAGGINLPSKILF